MELQNAEQWEDIKAVHQRTGFAVKSIRKWAAEGRIPYYKVFDRLRFKPSEINAWMNEGKRHSKPTKYPKR